MRLPNDEILHYKSDDGVSVIVQRTELVRCKDCKHHEELLNNNDGNVLCWVHGLDVIVDRNGYCNYGEREEQENESRRHNN